MLYQPYNMFHRGRRAGPVLNVHLSLYIQGGASALDQMARTQPTQDTLQLDTQFYHYCGTMWAVAKIRGSS